jgi:hypothetical protein
MAKTAVVAGTATAVHGAVSGSSKKKQAAADEQATANQAAYDSQQQLADMQSQLDATQAQQAAPAAGGDDMMSKLKELASLHDAGVLSDEEFAAAKAKVLA